MNRLLFERSTGNVGPNAFARLHAASLVTSLWAAPEYRFDGGERGAAVHDGELSPGNHIWAHQSGVNALALERFEGRILVSGGSDASIKIWDLEQYQSPDQVSINTFKPTGTIPRCSSPSGGNGHRFGVTHLSFYPFDSAAFLSTSFDQTLKLWSTDAAKVSGSFQLGSKVYTHAVSPIASHLLVACGTQHPAVRLVDLRSGANVQSLSGHGGAVLSASWSPRHEHVLATGSVDGTVRLWDIRRAGGAIGLLDLEDSLGLYYNGLLGVDGTGRPMVRRSRLSAKAHSAPVNGLTWTDDGNYIVSAGHDRRIRVWDAATGRNTLASFGPSIQNNQLSGVTMFTSPQGVTPPGKELLFWPNESEVLVMDLHEGTIITRLRSVGPSTAGVRSASGARGGERTVRNRITSLVWRGSGGGGSSSGVVTGGSNTSAAIYSAHLDGQIRAWVPALSRKSERFGSKHEGDSLDLDDDDDEDPDQKGEDRAKKRKALDDVFKSLMGKQITFS
ncbi:WD40-repeat-containing domain protein [Microdochium trichocladiopsis]|uniref:WD40-repeat-containing domain protein n=1 Tax=Microdochium trichocladiopsis TaxID=1682393 RepID=A0A9P8Y2A7_9PEZI|nr:WD40-repeat-containing domain protein [Microdochium trichocladiopsis]KAH7026249.1 WD40-repeat-containing domain protein [Microdochium trichocladiopsis]